MLGVWHGNLEIVIPAQAGIQTAWLQKEALMDSRLRGNDEIMGLCVSLNSMDPNPGQSHLNSIQINPLDFDAANDTCAFVGVKNLSPCGVSLPVPRSFECKGEKFFAPTSVLHANLLILKKFGCDRPRLQP
ncbi:MAG: hypothetical protein LBI48_11045 [Burkholderiaceae bacterium]|jgi:hypothetical protein|nr:hypothetical protein [Burkholderiaceae bacterium]